MGERRAGRSSRDYNIAAEMPACTLERTMLDETPGRRLVILVGASVRSAVWSVLQGGARAIAVDMFGDVDTQELAERWYRFDPAEPDRSLTQAWQYAQQQTCQRVDVLVTGGLESWADCLQPLRQNGSFLNPSADVIRSCRELDGWRRWSQAAGWRFPQTISRPPRVATHGWLKKSRFSSAGLAVENLLVDGETSRNIPSSANAETTNAYWQARVSGTAIGVSMAITATQIKVLGACRALHWSTECRPYLYAGALGPIPIGEGLEKASVRFANRLRGETGFTGLLGADLVVPRVNGAPWLVDVNPRYTASMELLERHQNRSFLVLDALGNGLDGNKNPYESLQEGAWLASSVHGCRPASRFEPDGGRAGESGQKCWLKFVLWSACDYQFSTSHLQRVLVESGGCPDEFIWCDRPQEGDRIAAGSPVITAITRTDRPAAVLTVLKRWQRAFVAQQ